MNSVQKRAHASEQEENFRWIYFLLATKSDQILTSDHLADATIQQHISDIGQYAEIAHGSISPSFVLRNLEELCRPGFPLESYEALKNDGSQFVKQFTGNVSDVQGYVAFRPRVRQLVIAFSGTSSFSQTLRDIQVWQTPYPSGENRSTVHSGFWEMYRGVRPHALEAMRVGFQEYGSAVDEIVLTGHSMGCTMCYFLALDLMEEIEDTIIPRGITLNITTFGSPRLGNKGLSEYWRTSLEKYRDRFGSHSVREYSVKGYNDGVHTLPPRFLGFRHLTLSPLYFYLGHLYHVPPSECEHGAFTVVEPGSTDERHSRTGSETPIEGSIWPKGGHNYYFRDMEKLQRQMRWLELSLHGEDKWQDRYVAELKAWEHKWGREETMAVVA